MAVQFNQRVPEERFLHQQVEFLPGVPVAFEDPNGDSYFINAGWAAATTDAPVRTYSIDEVSIDTTTRIAGSGALVIGEEA